MTSRELSIKLSCTHEIQALPKHVMPVFWSKIEQLLQDPTPQGNVRKKLTNMADLYRLRVGDLRVFYSFGPDWVRLLGIRSRGEAYTKKNESISAETPGYVPTSGDDDLGAAIDEDDDGDQLSAKRGAFVFNAESAAIAPVQHPLPRPLTPEWLGTLGVQATDIARLVLCTSEEELLACAISDSLLSRILDNLFPRPVDELDNEPNFVVGDVQQLVKFKEGTLTAFLLQLDAEQAKLVDWALKGPTLVRGGAGTGKSTVALYRVRALLRRANASGKERILFATYTKTLQRVSEQLLAELLNDEERSRVDVVTCDQITRRIAATNRKVGELYGKSLPLLDEVRAVFVAPGATPSERNLRTQAVARLSSAYLLDGFAWIIEGRGLTTLAEYLAAVRPGRTVALGPKMREAVWALWTAYSNKLSSSNAETFARWRREALSLVEANPGKFATYDHVLLDEAQDLTPIALRLMVKLCRNPEGIFLAADDKQSIYSRGFGFADAEPRLQFKGRTAVLTRNYRSTSEIDRAAFAILDADEGQVLEGSESPHHGPVPTLLQGVKSKDEGRWAAKFLLEMARYLKIRPSAAAVLVPDRESGRRVAKEMTQAGLQSVFVEPDQLDLDGKAVRVMTMHSAKGLEFPSVVVIARHSGATQAGEGEEIEAERRRRRLLYVAMTRAMRGLMVLQVRDEEDPLLAAMPTEAWDVVQAGVAAKTGTKL